jgi:hypothetical protein
MKVFTITLGYVEYTEIDAKFKEKALELGYPVLLDAKQDLEKKINNASIDFPVDLVDERELEEIKFMLTFFQDEEGFAKDDIPF